MTPEAIYHLTILLASMALLMTLVIRGKSIFVVAPLCALLAATFSGLNPVTTMTGPYMTGFSEYLRNFFLVFALGAAFGKLYEDSGAAAVIADRVGQALGRSRACLAVVLACAVLTYGGVSLFVVGFSVYPLAVQLFRAADLPRRFIPGAIAFGSITFTMTSAGSPEIQNLIPIKYLINEATKEPLTDARAGWPVSLIVSGIMFLAGQIYLDRTIARAFAAGERWEDRPSDAARPTPGHTLQPSLMASLSPLIVTLLALNVAPGVCHALAEWTTSLLAERDSEHYRIIELVAIVVRWIVDHAPQSLSQLIYAVFSGFPEDPSLSIFLGVLTGLVSLRGHLSGPWTCLGEGFVNGLLAIGSTCAVVGFGAAMKELPAFKLIIQLVTNLPGDPLIGAAIGIAIIAAIAGSASGGQGIAWPIIKPIYVDQLGVAPRALHRVVAISSGTLDSLPANGYLVMLIRNICGETHERAYFPIFVTTVLIPMLGTAVAITLFKLVPAWANW
jgi:H+/gluconate symporter-like permease